MQRRHDRSSATRLNPDGSNSRGTKRQPGHIIILMTAPCHEQHCAVLMTNLCSSVGHTHIPSGCLCTIGHYIGKWIYSGYAMARPVCLSLGLFSSAPVCLAWRQAFCLSECLLKPLMRYLSADWGHGWKERCVFIALDHKSESSWLPCLWSYSVTEW